MKVLFLGGTGVISAACSKLAVARGFDVTLLNRGRRDAIPGCHSISCDLADPAAVAATVAGRTWDAVVDFIAYNPADIGQRLSAFRDCVGQYIFVSSASVYQRPLSHHWVTESTPLGNPYWKYSRDKIACEELLLRAYREEGFPVTIIRPNHTYGDTRIPLALSSIHKSFTVVDRMRRGRPVIVPGDGLALWTLTHSTDFAKGLIGLLGHTGALGHAFHITSDEVLTWNQIYRTVAEAAGVREPVLVHIASDFLVACRPDSAGGLLGDKSNSAIFDNSKIRRFVPDFVATTRFRQGIAQTLSWFDADPSRRGVDDEANAWWDRVIAAYERGLEAARAVRES